MKISPTAELVSGYNKKMEELWLPNTNTLGSVKHSGSRESAGFVTRGKLIICFYIGFFYLSLLLLPSIINFYLSCRKFLFYGRKRMWNWLYFILISSAFDGSLAQALTTITVMP